MFQYHPTLSISRAIAINNCNEIPMLVNDLDHGSLQRVTMGWLHSDKIYLDAILLAGE